MTCHMLGTNQNIYFDSQFRHPQFVFFEQARFAPRAPYPHSLLQDRKCEGCLRFPDSIGGRSPSSAPRAERPAGWAQRRERGAGAALGSSVSDRCPGEGLRGRGYEDSTAFGCALILFCGETLGSLSRPHFGDLHSCAPPLPGPHSKSSAGKLDQAGAACLEC